MGLFYVVAARRVLCEIYNLKLFTRPGERTYVWFFIGKLKYNTNARRFNGIISMMASGCSNLYTNLYQSELLPPLPHPTLTNLNKATESEKNKAKQIQLVRSLSLFRGFNFTLDLQ